jgi:hypothetical protein
MWRGLGVDLPEPDLLEPGTILTYLKGGVNPSSGGGIPKRRTYG